MGDVPLPSLSTTGSRSNTIKKSKKTSPKPLLKQRQESALGCSQLSRICLKKLKMQVIKPRANRKQHFLGFLQGLCENDGIETHITWFVTHTHTKKNKHFSAEPSHKRRANFHALPTAHAEMPVPRRKIIGATAVDMSAFFRDFGCRKNYRNYRVSLVPTYSIRRTKSTPKPAISKLSGRFCFPLKKNERHFKQPWPVSMLKSLGLLHQLTGQVHFSNLGRWCPPQ